MGRNWTCEIFENTFQPSDWLSGKIWRGKLFWTAWRDLSVLERHPECGTDRSFQPSLFYLVGFPVWRGCACKVCETHGFQTRWIVPTVLCSGEEVEKCGQNHCFWASVTCDVFWQQEGEVWSFGMNPGGKELNKDIYSYFSDTSMFSLSVVSYIFFILHTLIPPPPPRPGCTHTSPALLEMWPHFLSQICVVEMGGFLSLSSVHLW